MAKFTTEKRRELTSSNGYITDDSTKVAMDNQMNLAYANEFKKDKTNNEVFRIVNSQLTGLAFEYRYLKGKYHPTLDEVEIFYTDAGTEKDDTQYVQKSYWDSMKLQSAANLDAGNEFHLNTREGTTVSYPIRPEKYASWVDDSDESIIDFETTEANLLAMVETLNNWYTNGYSSGTVDTTITGPYYENDPSLNVNDDKQIYMPVGYSAYQVDPNNGYMTEGYDKTGEIILINGSDSKNFAFGKIVACKDLPSRILFQPYGKIGTIPDDSSIVSTFSTNEPILIDISAQVIENLHWFYTMARHYLDYNKRNDIDQSNIDTLSNLNDVISLIEIWENDSNKLLFSTMIALVNSIKAIRTTTVNNDRISYINGYLSTATELYNDRFNVIDLRLSKVGGTLKELMTIDRGSKVVNTIMDEQSNAADWYTRFFIVAKARKDGDYYRRLFVDKFTPSATTFQVGDTCYILSDDETVPEIKSTITDITKGRIIDMINTTYDDEGNANIAYIECNKIFFKDVIFSKKYLTSDNLRIIKEI